MKRLNLIHPLFGCLMLIVLMGGCKKEEIDLRNPVPEILSVTTNSNSIREFQDSLVFFVEYRDGDGDLGFVEPSKYAVFIRDLRLPEFDGFYIGPLAPLESDIAIQGVIHIEFPSLFLFGNRNSETTVFEIKFIDRSGNESNLITTEPVVIIKP